MIPLFTVARDIRLGAVTGEPTRDADGVSDLSELKREANTAGMKQK